MGVFINTKDCMGNISVFNFTSCFYSVKK